MPWFCFVHIHHWCADELAHMEMVIRMMTAETAMRIEVSITSEGITAEKADTAEMKERET
jgi:hypothetical protein